MNIEDHIRLINRKKIKLKEELISHNLNYYTWQTPYSPDRQCLRSPEKKTPEIKAFSREQSPMMAKSNYNPRDRTIQVSNDRELQFLIDRNRWLFIASIFLAFFSAKFIWEKNDFHKLILLVWNKLSRNCPKLSHSSLMRLITIKHNLKGHRSNIYKYSFCSSEFSDRLH